MRIARGLSAPLLILALALTGCGGDDSDSGDKDAPSGANSTDTSTDTSSEAPDDEPASSGSLDACTLLTPADLKKAFGSAFDSGESTHQDESGGDQCVWTAADAPPAKTFSVTVLRDGSLEGALGQSGLTVKELHEQGRAAFSDAEKVDIGDDAFLAQTLLVVLKGDTQYTFTTLFGQSDAAIDGMKALATQIVG